MAVNKDLFAVVDIETTGLRVKDDRITEVAVLVYNGSEIVESFHSLINPERYVPEFITQLTGINNEMLETAPRFFEVAKAIVEITEGKVFVAHNAHFDFTFLKNEFKSLGFNFQRKTLCTARLSRKILPGLPSYALDKICRHLNISIKDRHRAMGDAEATCELLGILKTRSEKKLERNIIDREIKVRNLPPKVKIEDFEALPEETGVYYFLDEAGSIIYIGKSINIKKRIASHFSTNLDSKKSIEFKNRVASIDYVLTGSELIAELLESDEIKQHKPLFNRAQRNSRHNYGVFSRKGRDGYLRLYVDRTKTQTKTAHYLAQRADGARRALYAKIEQFGLCMKLCDLYSSDGACFAYQVKQCQGACIGEEEPALYNARVEQAIDSFGQLARKSFFVLTPGRERGEKAMVCIERGRYLGFAYLQEDQAIQTLEDAKSYITRYRDNRDVQKIIRSWIKKHPKHVFYFNQDSVEEEDALD